MADQSAARNLYQAAALTASVAGARDAPKVNPVFTGDFSHAGTKFGVNGKAPIVKAAAIASPTAPSATYVQAEAASMKTAVDAIRVALANVGIIT